MTNLGLSNDILEMEIDSLELSQSNPFNAQDGSNVEAVKGSLALQASFLTGKALASAAQKLEVSAPAPQPPTAGFGAVNPLAQYNTNYTQQAPVGAVDGFWPYDPNSDTNDSGFNFNFANIANMSPSQILVQLKNLMQYIKQYGVNQNSNGQLIDFMVAIGQNWNVLNKNGAMAPVMNALSNMTVSGVSFPMFLAQQIMEEKFYIDGPDQGTMNDWLNQVMGRLSGGTANPFIAQLQSAFSAVQGSLGSWYSNHWDQINPITGQQETGPDMDSQEACWMLEGNQDNFLRNCHFSSFMSTYTNSLVGEILRTHTNGSEVIILLMALLGGDMDDDQTSIGGYGGITKSINDMNKMGQDIQTMFNQDAGNWNTADAMQMMQNIHAILDRLNYQQSRYGLLPNQMMSAYGNILNYVNPNGNGQSLEWDAEHSNDPAAQQALVAGLDSMFPSGTPPNTGPWQQAISGLNQASTNISDQNTVINQSVSQINSQLQTILGSNKDMLDKWTSWVQDIADHYAQANQ